MIAENGFLDWSLVGFRGLCLESLVLEGGRGRIGLNVMRRVVSFFWRRIFDFFFKKMFFIFIILFENLVGIL